MSRWSSLVTACVIILLLLLVLTLYTFLHEGGHALVGLLYRGKITSFSVNFFNLSAHVGINGSFSPLQNALISVAGVTLPVLVCMYLILFTAPKSEPVFAWFKLIFFASAVNALLAWIVIPVLVLAGQTPSDDSVNFLHYTHLHPLLVTGAALLLYLICWWMFVRHMGGFRALVEQLRGQALDLTLAETRKSIGVLAALGVAVALVTFGLTRVLPASSVDAPPGYQRLTTLQLSQGPFQDQSIYTLKLDQPATVSLYFSLVNIKGGPILIHLTGNQHDMVFFEIHDPKAELSQASVNPQHLKLEKGEYDIQVTFSKSEGTVGVYIKHE